MVFILSLFLDLSDFFGRKNYFLCSWRIKGKGAEKARLAYAVSVNGSIVYEVAQGAGPLARASATL